MKRGSYMEMRAPKTLPLRRAAVCMLLFSFIFSPFYYAYAQETEVPQEESSETTEASTPIVEDDSSNDIPATNIEETPEDTTASEGTIESEPLEPEMSAMSSGGSEADTGTLFINNESTKSAAPDVDTQTGALQFGYTFTVPPGRNGVEPHVSLAYSSNSTDNTDLFGYGWALSTPSITRLNKYGIDTLYTADTFSSSLDGELVRVGTTTSFRPKVESGAFREYTLASSTWTVLEKDGTRMTFGSTTAARRDDTASSTRIYAWELEETRDTNDNYVKYTYFKDAGQIYPASITYTGNGSTDGPFLIEFSRESRNDNLVSYETGFAATTTYRINNVKASIDGYWVTSYDLAYTAGHNGNRSLLASITKKGRDEVTGQEVTLPATLFEYETYGTGDKKWVNDMSIDVPVNIVESIAQPESGARFVDINGDGLPDIIKSFGAYVYPSNSPPYDHGEQVFLNTGDGWATSTDWTLPSAVNGRFGFATSWLSFGPESAYHAESVDLGARFADVNGDGYTDILWGYSTSAVSISGGYAYDYSIRDVYINNKVDGWATSTVWTLPTGINFAYDATPEGGRIADVNGDGLPDLLSTGCSAGGDVYMNTGAGWSMASTSWTVPEGFTCGGTDLGTQIADLNGDGLADIMRSHDIVSGEDGYPGVRKVYLNNGNGWSYTPSWSIPVAFALHKSNAPYNHSLSPRLTDVNGDGLADIIRSSTAGSDYADGYGVYINTGEGWVQDSNWAVPSYFKFTKTNSSKTYQRDSGYAEMDVDGDNLIDFVKSGVIDSPSPYNYYPHEESVNLHAGTVPDLLSSITYPEGGEIAAQYEQSARYMESGEHTNPNLPSNLNTVAAITYDDGVTDPYENTFVYGGGANYFASSTERKFAGFATTTRTDASGNTTTTYIHQGNASESSLGEYNDSYEKIGKPYLTEVRDNNGHLYSRSIYRWESTPTGSSTSFVFNSRQIKQDYDGDSDHRDTAIETSYDLAGNIATTTEWGEAVASTTDGTFTDIGPDKRTIVYAYATTTGSRITDSSSRIMVFDQPGTKIRESVSYYDDLGFGSLSKGNLTKSQAWATSTEYLDTRRVYDEYGLIQEIVNPRGATTTYTYDSHHLYPGLVTNALSHTASSTYDYSSGNKRISIDANGYASENIFDGLDRTLTKKEPDSSTGVSVTSETNSYTDTRNRFSIETNTYLSATSSIPSHMYVDGFGRKVQERIKAEDEDIFVVRDWTYGSDGLLRGESLPYFSEDSDDTPGTSRHSLLTRYEYDPLKRRVSIKNAVGETEIEHDQWRETIIDPLAHRKDHTYDAFGHLIGVDEHLASSTYITTYAWDRNDNLVSITDALGNIRSFTYDALKRRLSAEDLHHPSDDTFGIWFYEYDKNGNVGTTTDPKGQVVSNTYDLLDRKLTEDYLGSFGSEVTYRYDLCTNGIGLLCVATSTDSTTAYAYDARGLVNTESKVIYGSTFVTQYTHDRNANPVEITYPDGSAVAYTYNDAGKVETIQQKESGSAYMPVAMDLDYGPNGQVTYQLYSNGAITERIYDEDNVYRLASIQISTSTPRIGLNQDWYSGSWSHRTRISILHTKVDADVVDFPVLINLGDLPSGFHSHVNTDGSDIRVTKADGITEIPRELVNYNPTNDTGELYLKGSLQNATNTDFYIYYGNAGASDYAASSTYGRNAVWSDYLMVVHGRSLTDATGKRTLTNNGSVATTTGKIGDTFVFNGSNYISAPDASDIDLVSSDLSISAWLYNTSYPSNKWEYPIVTKNSNAVNSAYNFSIRGTKDSTNLGKAMFNNGNQNVTFASTTISQNAWSYLNLSFKDSTHLTNHFKGGSTNGSGTNVGSSVGNTQPLKIGGQPGDGFYFVGSIDEMRLRGSTTTPGWISTEYNNQNLPSSFYSTSTEQNQLTEDSIASTTLLKLTYAYDDIGNITSVTESQGNGSPVIRNYVYNDLYRLSSVSFGTTTVEEFIYDGIGNLLSKTGEGSYVYGGIGYANPHAVTDIASSSTYSYDNNGNLISGPDSGYAWTYNNLVDSVTTGSTTASYGYDHASARVLKTTGSVSTRYPNRYFEATGTSTTKHIYLGDELVATVYGTGTSTATTTYVHGDHLGSTRFVTDSAGNTVQSLEYSAFGAQTANTQLDSRSQTNQYIGQDYDSESSLSYLNARYYEGSRGQFLSQDPVFWEIGQTPDGISVLSNPQLQNSYSYAGNNPITNKDPNGRHPGIIAGAIGGGIIGVGALAISDFATGQSSGWNAYAGAAAGGAVGGAFIGSGAGIVALVGGGLAGGATQGIVREGLDVATGGSADYMSIAEDTAWGGATSAVGGTLVSKVGVPAIKGVTAGRGSMSSVSKQINTKLANGTINSASLKTQGKMVVASTVNGVYDGALQVGQNISSSYNQTVSNLQKQVSNLQKQVNQLRK